MKNYYRLITGVDAVIGKLMNKLEALQIADNTIIVFMGDNGMSLGEKGIEGKWFGQEESIRVPLIIKDPRSADKIKQYKAGQMALNIDIAPTILSMAGLPIPPQMEGMNLMDVVSGKTAERTDFFYQHYFLGSPNIPKVEGVVTKDIKYMKFIEHNYEELYDILHDPHEIDNLVNNPNYKNQLKEMRKKYLKLNKKYAPPSPTISQQKY